MPPEMSLKISQLHSGKFIQPSKIVADATIHSTVTLLNELTKGGAAGGGVEGKSSERSNK